MNDAGKSILQKIGSELDCFNFPRVKNGGIVVPSDPAVPSILGKEHNNESSTSGTSGAGKKAHRREGAPRKRSWSPSQASSLVGASLQTRFEDELDDLSEAYPGLRLWQQNDGIWLRTESSVIPNLQCVAIFFTGISYPTGMIRSWGFWKHPLASAKWIGPRHTNFPDGSICAFELSDQTWVAGDSLVELMDFYTLWALRHLHLEEFGRWPGPQVVVHPYERILELKPDEYCGCGKYDKRYGDCCQKGDLAQNQIRQAVNFVLKYSGGLRAPPQKVIRLALDQSEPPSLSELLMAA